MGRAILCGVLGVLLQGLSTEAGPPEAGSPRDAPSSPREPPRRAKTEERFPLHTKTVFEMNFFDKMGHGLLFSAPPTAFKDLPKWEDTRDTPERRDADYEQYLASKYGRHAKEC